jgi:hypothetical protein
LYGTPRFSTKGFCVCHVTRPEAVGVVAVPLADGELEPLAGLPSPPPPPAVLGTPSGMSGTTRLSSNDAPSVKHTPIASPARNGRLSTEKVTLQVPADAVEAIVNLQRVRETNSRSAHAAGLNEGPQSV